MLTGELFLMGRVPKNGLGVAYDEGMSIVTQGIELIHLPHLLA